MQFSQRLKRMRKELHLKQADLARACGVKLTAISKYETDIVKPAFEMLSKIGLAYNVNLNWLINDIGNMFIETPQRRLLKTGSDDFYVEVTENKPAIVMESSHNMELETDLKVEYYGAGNENFTKIYHKDGKVEYQAGENSCANLQSLVEKITEISQNKNQFEFVLTAINAINDKNALAELKTLIKGMELRG